MFKRILSFVTVLVLLLALALPCFAAATATVTLTLTGNPNDSVGSTVIEISSVTFEEITYIHDMYGSQSFGGTYGSEEAPLRFVVDLYGISCYQEATSLFTMDESCFLFDGGYYYSSITFSYDPSDVVSYDATLCQEFGFTVSGVKTYTQAEVDALIAVERQNAYGQGHSAGYLDGIASVNTDSFYQDGYTAGQESVDTDSFYQDGYTAGQESVDTDSFYQDGYTAGQESIDTDAYYQDGYTAGQESVDTTAVYDSAYASGYDTGFREGEQSELSGNFINVISEIAAAPYNAIKIMFDFDIFGINISGLIYKVITVLVTLLVIGMLLDYIF